MLKSSRWCESMEKRLFPLDIFAVKQYGVERWQREFFWPVSDNEYLSLANDIEQLFIHSVAKFDDLSAKVLLVKRPITMDYNTFLHSLWVVQRVSSLHFQPLYSKHIKWYPSILSATEPPRMGYLGCAMPQKERMSRVQNALSAVKWLGRSMSYNGSFYGKQKTVKEKYFLYGVGSPYHTDYVRSLSHWVSVTPPWRWYAAMKTISIPDALLKEITGASEYLVNEVCNIGERYGVVIEPHHREYLKRHTLAHLCDALETIMALRVSLQDCSAMRMLLPGLSNQFQKCLAIVLRERGGRVISFAHGGSIGMLATPVFSVCEFQLSDEFITYSAASVDLFTRINSLYPTPRRNTIHISSFVSDYFLRFYQRLQNISQPRRVCKVMIVGFVHKMSRHYSVSASFSLIQLDLELRLADLLIKNGFSVLYKPHPDSLEVVKKLFNNAVKIVSGDFREKTQDADAFIFGLPHSTAFPFALFTDKPVLSFAIKDEWGHYFSEPMDMLKRRCTFIPAHLDMQSRLQFNEQKLLEALASPIPVEFDQEFIKTYLAPDLS